MITLTMDITAESTKCININVTQRGIMSNNETLFDIEKVTGHAVFELVAQTFATLKDKPFKIDIRMNK